MSTRHRVSRHPAVLVGTLLAVAALGSIVTAPSEYPVTAVLLLPLGSAALFGWRVTAVVSSIACVGGTILAIDGFDGAALWFRLLFLAAGSAAIVMIAAGREARERALARTDELRAVEAELRASEQRYRRVLDATTSIVVVTDADGRFVEPQPVWESYTGQNWEQHQGHGWLDAFAEDDRAALRAVWTSDGSRVEPEEKPIRLWHAPTNGYRFVILRGAAVIDGGVAREWIGTVTDRHEHVLAEQRRENVEDLRAAVLSSLQDGLLITDRRGRVIEVSEAFTRLVGFERDECIGTEPPYPWQPDPDENPTEWRHNDAVNHHLATSGPPGEFEITCRHRDGHLIPTLTTVAVYREDDRVRLVISSVKNIAERKAAENALRAERDFREAIVASLQEGLFLLAPDGTVLEVNDAWTSITGYKRETAVGQQPPYPWWPEDERTDERFMLLLGEPATGPQAREHEGIIARADGGKRLVVVNRQPIRDPRSGDIVAIVGTFRDISRRAEAEARVRTFAALSARLATCNDVAGVAQATLEQLLPVTAAELGAVIEIDATDDTFSVAAARGVAPETIQKWSRAPVDANEILEARFESLADDIEGLSSFVVLPLERAQTVVGALVLASRRVTDLQSTNADLFSGALPIVAQALERARLFELQTSIASTLQEAMLPESPTDMPGLSIATRYQPAVADLEVGGDWFDVVPLGDGRVAIAVGDIVGRGLEAAAVMGQLRSALGALAHTTPSASDAVTRLDRYAQGVRGAKATTVCYGIVDVNAQTFRFTTAGHAPPLIVDGNGNARFLEHAHGWPLGVVTTETPRPEATVDVPPDSTLLLYTDGLIERRGRRLEDGLDLLAHEAAKYSALPVERLCDELLDALAPEALSDDTAVVALRLTSADARAFTYRAAADPEQLSLIRKELRAWLARHDVPAPIADDVILAVGEACTNAVEHAYSAERAKSLVVEAHRDRTGVVLTIRDYGHWRPQPPDPRRNRGLRLMATLMDDVAVTTPTGGGTRVSMRRNLAGV